LSTISTTVPTEAECAREPANAFENQVNPTKTALQAAVFLLTRPAAERARYVCVIDTGIEPRTDTGRPYDVHSINHPGDTGSNLWNTFRTHAVQDRRHGSRPLAAGLYQRADRRTHHHPRRGRLHQRRPR